MITYNEFYKLFMEDLVEKYNPEIHKLSDKVCLIEYNNTQLVDNSDTRFVGYDYNVCNFKYHSGIILTVKIKKQLDINMFVSWLYGEYEKFTLEDYDKLLAIKFNED